MTYADIKAQILAAVADEAGDTYETSAERHFALAVQSLIADQNFETTDLSGYIQTTTIEFDQDNNSYSDISSLNVGTIIDIYPDPTGELDVTITIKKHNQINKISSNTQLQPSDRDLYIYQIGDQLHLIKSSNSNFDPATDKLTMVYLQDIDTSEWSDTKDISGLMSIRFIHNAIEKAIQTLSAEVAQNE